MALARSLAVEPRLLLLDEPLSALDAGLRERLAGDLHAILRAAGTTALLVTHDHEEAFAVADRIAVMREGRIVQQGDIADVWRAPADPETALFLGYARVVDGDAAARLVPRGQDRSPCAVRHCAWTVPARWSGGSSRLAPLPSRCGWSWTSTGSASSMPSLRSTGTPARVSRCDLPRITPGWQSSRTTRTHRVPRLGRVYRRAYALMVGTALLMGGLAVLSSVILDKSLADPEGSFLGPSYIRLPLLLLGALLLDMLPRTLWYSRLKPTAMPAIVRDRWRAHWNRERFTLVALGIICFYVVYVSYRNLKSFLPFINETMYDRELHLLDRALFFGHEPATILHGIFGTSATAYLLSYIYLAFLPMVPLGVTAWLVWSRNLSFGYWFVTSQCLAWTLGTASYYALPTLGPGLEYVFLYNDLADTPTSGLMDSLVNARQGVRLSGLEGQVQSVAGFASLHCAITLLLALMVQYTIRSSIAKWIVWINFGLTVVATLYFGWHYVADDLAGIVIAMVSFYVGGLASGQKFDRKLTTSHPTTTTGAIPVRQDS